MSKAQSRRNVVYLLCSPSLGLLDNWLSVLWSLKRESPGLSFRIVFPKSNAVDQVNHSNVLIRLASEIFDTVVYKSEAGIWMQADSFAEFKEQGVTGTVERILLKAISRSRKWPVIRQVGRLFGQAHGAIIRQRRGDHLYDWSQAVSHTGCVLFDVYEESKPYNREVLQHTGNAPKFSIQHGINIQVEGGGPPQRETSDAGGRTDVKAYLFSSKEQVQYQQKYDIDPSSMEVVGVPRHAPQWMDRVRKATLEGTQESGRKHEGTIFVISRPAGTNYHPIERKRKALEDIKRLAWEDLNLNIVVKLHPKERMEGLYEDVFGLDTFGDRWSYSDLHPFVLGKASTFAISFYSGVVIDMLALGVPTIEYLDLRGLPDVDTDSALRDRGGHPVFGYRYQDLVLGASDYNQMKVHVEDIMHDREGVVSRLQAQYSELFPQIENINQKMAVDILEMMSLQAE